MATNLRDRGYGSSMDNYNAHKRKVEERKEQEKTTGPVSTLRLPKVNSTASSRAASTSAPIQTQRFYDPNVTRATPGTGGGRGTPHITEQEFNRSTAMTRSYGNYNNYLNGIHVTGSGFADPDILFKNEPNLKNLETVQNQFDQALNVVSGDFEKKASDYERWYRTITNQYQPMSDAQKAQGDQLYADYMKSLDAYQKMSEAHMKASASNAGVYANVSSQRRKWYDSIRDEKDIDVEEKDLMSQLDLLEDQKYKVQSESSYAKTQTLHGITTAQGLETVMNSTDELDRLDRQIDEVKAQLELLDKERAYSRYFKWQELANNNMPVSARRMQGGAPSWLDKIISGTATEEEIMQAINEGNINPSNIAEMLDDEKQTYRAIYQQYGPAKAKEYVDELERYGNIRDSLNTRRRMTDETKLRNWVKKGSPFGRQFAASVLTVLASPTKVLSYVGQGADYLFSGEMTKDADYNVFSYAPNAVTAQIGENITKWGEEHGSKWVQKWGDFGYQTALSMATFLYTTALTGGFGLSPETMFGVELYNQGYRTAEAVSAYKAFKTAEALSLGLMGTEAAADAVMQAKDRGLDDGQAFWMGTAAGAIEILTEKFSVENLLEGVGDRSRLLSFLKSMFTEGSEEVASDLSNMLVDSLVAKDKSEFNQSVKNYMKEYGVSKQEALKAVWTEQLKSVGLSGLGGAISGGFMGGGNIVRSNVSNLFNRSAITSPENVANIVNRAQGLNEWSAGARSASALQGKLDAGEKFTIREVLKARNAIETDRKTDPKYVGALIEAAQDYGDSDAKKQADKLQTKLDNGKVKVEDVEKLEEAIDLERLVDPNREDLQSALKYGETADQKSEAYVLTKGIRDKIAAGEKLSLEEVSAAESAVNTAKATSAEGLKSTIESGLASDQNSPAYKSAQQLQSKLDSGAEITLAEVSEARRAVRQAEEADFSNTNPEVIGRRLITESGRQALTDAATILKNSTSQSDVQRGNQMLQAIKDGNLDAKTAGEVFLRSQKILENTRKQTPRVLQPREVTADMDAFDRSAAELGISVEEASRNKSILQAFGVEGEYRSFENNNLSAYYDRSTGKVYINANADNPGLALIAHEVTHSFENTAGYKKLADLVFSQSKDLSADLQRITQEYKDAGINLDDDGARSELVSEFVEQHMFNDEKFINDVVSTDRSLAQKFLSAIDNLLAKLGNKNAQQRKLLREARDLWAEALQQRMTSDKAKAKIAEKRSNGKLTLPAVEAKAAAVRKTEGPNLPKAESRKIQTANAELNQYGINIDADSGAAVSYSIRTAPTTVDEIKLATDRLVNAGFDRADAENWLKSLTSVSSVIMQNMQELDYVADERYSWLKKNSEYPQGSVDFNNNCPKRAQFTAVFDRLQSMMPERIFTASDYETIRSILKKHGIPVTCGPCYVEDRRQHLGKIAGEFIDQLKNGTLKSNIKQKLNGDTFIPNQNDLVTYTGLRNMYDTHRGIHDAFVAFNNARGQQAGRLLEGLAEYDNQIKKWRTDVIRNKNDRGGLRIFSLSDADPRNMIDMIQIVIDSAEKGLMIQGYTQKPWFARFIKDTGVKMLRSHIPAGNGVRNGKLVFDNVEGIDTTDPDYFDATNERNIGDTVIGINDEMIRIAMLDPGIDQIIPFHTNLAKEIRNQKQIGHWNPYNGLEDRNVSDGKKAETQINIYTDVLEAWEKKGTPITNRQEFVEAFLQVCDERGLIPRFDKFLNVDENGKYVYTPGYEKFLVDYKLFDRTTGEIIPQEAVKPIFDDAYNQSVLENYVKGAKNLPKVSEDVFDEIKRHFTDDKLSLPKAESVRMDIADEFTGETEEEREANISAEAANRRYSIVKDSALIKQLDDDDHVTRYRWVQERDGKYYSPMAGMVDGKWTDPIEFGVWEQADERPDKAYIPKGKKGYYFDLVKGLDKNGKPKVVPARYNPYIHSSSNVFGDQFSSASSRPELRVMEVRVPKSELTSGYKAQYAKDAVGDMNWHSGPVSTALKYLSPDNSRIVTLSRYDMPVRVLSTQEVAQQMADILKDTNIPVPEYTVTPDMLAELKKLSVKTVDKMPVEMQSKALKAQQKAQKKTTKQYAISKSDTAYLKAVESGDMETAQRMVDEAAEKAGFNYFRYTRNAMSALNNYDLLQMFVDRKGAELARGYGDYQYVANGDGAVDAGDILSALREEWEQFAEENGYETDISDDELNPNDIVLSAGVWDNADFVTWLFDKDFFNQYTQDDVPVLKTEDGLIVFGEDYSRVKSADPVTYDDSGEPIPLSERFNPQNDDIRYAISKDATIREDAEYMKAVETGDEKTQRRLVEDAARKAGYTIKAYHGTNQFGFTKIVPSKKNSRTLDGIAFYVTTDPYVAGSYSNTAGVREITQGRGTPAYSKDDLREYAANGVPAPFIDAENSGNYQFYIKPGNILELDAQGRNWNHVPFNPPEFKAMFELLRALRETNRLDIDTYEERRLQLLDRRRSVGREYQLDFENASNETRKIVAFAKSRGYDGVVFKNVVDVANEDFEQKASDVYALFNPQEQAKSADPVTYDDSGNPIPLSERFNPNNPDIRYAINKDATLKAPSIDEILGKADGATQEQWDEIVRDIRMYAGDTKAGRTLFDMAQTHGISAVEQYIRTQGMEGATVQAIRKYFAPADQMIDDAISPKAERVQGIENALDDFIDEAQKPGADRITTRVDAPYNGTPEDIIIASALYLYRKMVDSGEAVSRLGKYSNDPHLYHYYNMARASTNAAVSMIQNAQADVMGRKVGDSLNQIFDRIRAKGDDYYADLQLYLYHMLNVERMSRENPMAVVEAREEMAQFRRDNPEFNGMTDDEIMKLAYDPISMYHEQAQLYADIRKKYDKALAMRNKPVFGMETRDEFGNKKTVEIDAKTSQKVAAELREELSKVDGFEEDVEAIYKYIDNLTKYRIDSGLITEDDYKTLRKAYPHYVPAAAMMQVEEAPVGSKEKSTEVGKTIKRAKGNTRYVLQPLHKVLAQQTLSTVREGSKNRFGQMLLDRKGQSRGMIKNVEKLEGDFNEDTFDQETKNKDNTFVVRQDGKRYEIKMDNAMYEAIDALSPTPEDDNIFMKALHKGTDLFKALNTSLNPVFMIKNPIRDLQDAGLYSKDLSEFVKQYPLAAKEIAKNGEYWQLYQSLGGLYSSMFDFMTGERKQSNKLKAMTLDKFEALQMGIEQAPRLAEFMATVKKAEAKGEVTMDDLMEAIYNAAEVTVNFGRSGKWGKALNRGVVPFFNPGIQGMDKIIRTVANTEGFNEWAKLAGKFALLGVVPAILNRLLWGKRKDYEEMTQNNRDGYYLFPLRYGVWLRLPKGRALSVFGMATDRIIQMADGKDADWASFFKTAWHQIAPETKAYWQPFKDAKLLKPDNPGTTWYGGDIENRRMQSLAPGERYDTSTDAISKWIGKTFGLSPKKVNYLLDQYSGVLGDIFLPLMSQKVHKDIFTSAFTVDTDFSNRLSNDFYNLLDKSEYAKNSTNATPDDTSVYKYLYGKSLDINKVNKAIREIEEDSSLSNKEKEELTRAQYMLRNEIMRDAITQMKDYQAGGTDNDVYKSAEEARAQKARESKTYNFKGQDMAWDDLSGRQKKIVLAQESLDSDKNADLTSILGNKAPSQGAMYTAARDAGISNQKYLDALTAVDNANNGDSNYTNDETTAGLNQAIADGKISQSEANKLWPIISGGSPKNNPYSSGKLELPSVETEASQASSYENQTYTFKGEEKSYSELTSRQQKIVKSQDAIKANPDADLSDILIGEDKKATKLVAGYQEARAKGISNETYLLALTAIDDTDNGDGNYSQKKEVNPALQELVDEGKISSKDASTIWKIITGGADKNNPFPVGAIGPIGLRLPKIG